MIVHVSLSSNPVAPLLAEIRGAVEPMSLDTILRFAVAEGNLRRTVEWGPEPQLWHEDLDEVRDYLGDFLRDAEVEYPAPTV